MAHVPVDAMVATADASVADAQELHVGAVPVPGEYVEPERSVNQLDRSVDVKDLPTINAKWGKRVTLKYRGRVSVALHVRKKLSLLVVDTVTETESGYPGALETIELGDADDHDIERDDDAFSPRDFNYETGAYVGPVMFAVRLLPRRDAPESERRQFVVYTNKRTILVAVKRVDASTWTPLMRIDVPKASELVAMNPGWH